MKKSSLLLLGTFIILALLMLAGYFNLPREQTILSPNREQTRQPALDKLAFVKISKEFISGKTGKPVRTIDILQQRHLLVRDATDKVVRRSVLEEDSLRKINKLVQGNTLIHEEIVDCDLQVATDVSYVLLTVVKERKTVTFKMTPNCRMPPLLGALSQFVDRIVKDHFPDWKDGT